MSLSRLAFGAAAIGLAAAVACLDDAPVGPGRPEVQLALAARIQGTLQGRRVAIEVSYQRTDQAIVPLRVTPPSVELTTGDASTTAEISVEIGPGLADDLARIGGERGCLLTVELTLLDQTGRVLALQRQSPSAPVLPDQRVETPMFTLVPPLLTIQGGGEGTGSGVVTAAEAGGQPSISCAITDGTASPDGCSQSYPHGTIVTLVAGDGDFLSWEGACSGDGTCQVVLVQDLEVRATFAAAFGEPTQLIFLEGPSTTVAAAVMSPALRVAAEDAQGNIVATYSDPITLAIGANPGAGALTGGGAATPVNGVATFPVLSVNRGGVGYTLVARSGSLPVATSGAFTVTASPNLSTIAASPSTIRAGSGAASITVTARDALGGPLPGLNVLLSATGSGNTFIQPSAPTNAQGQATGTFASTVVEPKVVAAQIAGVGITPTTILEVVPGIVFVGGSVGSPSTRVFAVNPDGSEFGPLASLGPAETPRWSPDRRRVAYSIPNLDFPPHALLAIVTAAGDTSVIVVSDIDSRQARYSPGGIHLAFECPTYGGEFFTPDPHVCVIPDVSGPILSLDGIGNGDSKRVVSELFNPNLDTPGAFAWDPRDPDRLAVVKDTLVGFTRISRIFTVRYDGTDATALSDFLITGANDTLFIDALDWAPDGSYLAFSADARPGFQRKIYRIDRNGSNLRQLTTPSLDVSEEDFDPVISPDGRSILFLRSGFAFEGSVDDYFVVDAVTGALRQVSAELAIGGDDTDLAHDWSPDGNQIVLVGGTSSGRLGVFVVPATTTSGDYFDVRRLLSPVSEDHAQPSWRP